VAVYLSRALPWVSGRPPLLTTWLRPLPSTAARLLPAKRSARCRLCAPCRCAEPAAGRAGRAAARRRPGERPAPAGGAAGGQARPGCRWRRTGSAAAGAWRCRCRQHWCGGGPSAHIRRSADQLRPGRGACTAQRFEPGGGCQRPHTARPSAPAGPRGCQQRPREAAPRDRRRPGGGYQRVRRDAAGAIGSAGRRGRQQRPRRLGGDAVPGRRAGARAYGLHPGRQRGNRERRRMRHLRTGAHSLRAGISFVRPPDS